MTTAYPAALDAFSNPTPGQSQQAPRTHSQQHSDLNDAIEAIQAALGILGSANHPGQLRADLLAGDNDAKGAALVKFKQSGVGAAVRFLLDKIRETVTPEDFGAVGDGTDRPVSQWLSGGARDRGYANLAAIQVDYPHVAALTDSIDWAALQAAINACESSGKVLRLSGHYQANRALTNDVPINIDGGGVFQAGAGTTPTYIAGARITATAAMSYQLHLQSSTASAGFYGARINGILFDANNLAQKCVQADSLIRCSITNLEGLRATVVGFDFNDGNNTYFFKNWINAVYYNSTASAAAQNSDGIWFRDTGSVANLGCVQNHVGWIGSFTVNGNGVVVGGADNNSFGAIGCNTSTGTGTGLVWKGPTGFVSLQPRNNFVVEMWGTVVNQTSARTNTIRNMSSEGVGITLSGGGTAEVKFRAFNYVTGEYWSTPDYTMKDVRQFSIGDVRNLNGTESTLNSIWPCIDLADGVDQGFGISVLMNYNWHSGNLKAITIAIAMSTAVAGNVRLRVRGMTPAAGGTTATPTLDEQFTITPNAAAGVYTKHTLTFTPLAVTKGDLVLLRVDRVGSDGANDTHTGVLKVLGGGLHYTATGPTSDGGGGGPWNVLDPVI